MKRISLLIGLSILTIGIFAQTKNFIDQPYIEVTGKAKMEVVPNEIYLSIILQDADSKGKKAVDELEIKMINAFNKIGIDTKEDLSIKDLSSDFKFYTLKRTDIFTSKNYELLIHDTKTLSQVLEQTQKLGISNISLIKTDHSNIKNLEQQVKIDALKNAKLKANSLAEAIDQKAGNALFIQEKANHVYRTQMRTMAMDGVGASSQNNSRTSNIEFDKLKIEFEIFCRFILE